MEEIVLARGLTYIICCIITYFAFRRFFYSIFDPFASFLLVIPSSIALSTGSEIIWYIIMASIAFWVGMYITSPVPVSSLINKVDKCEIKDVNILESFAFFFFFISVLSSIMSFVQVGIPLLSDKPSEAKVSGFEGLGLLRRLKFIGSIAPICLIILILSTKYKKARKKYIIFLFILLFLNVLAGSKASVLTYIVMMYYFFKISPLGKTYYERHHNLIKKGFVLGVFLAFGVLIFVAIVESDNEGGTPIFSILFRLMEFGDVMLYYSDQYVRYYCAKAYTWPNFIFDELNEVLGMLRLVPYKYPIGYNMVTAYWEGRGVGPDAVTGPNAVFFVKGHMYFGFIGGIVFSAIIGAIFAKIRKWFFVQQIKSVFKYAIACYLFFTLSSFLRESGMFFGNLFSFVIFATPVYLISSYIIYKRNNERKKCIYNNSSMECSLRNSTDNK